MSKTLMRLAALATLAITLACGGNGFRDTDSQVEAPPGTLLQVGPEEQQNASELLKQHDELMASYGINTNRDQKSAPGINPAPNDSWGQWLDILSTVGTAIVPQRSVTYASRTAIGAYRAYTGRVFFPATFFRSLPIKVPLVIYPHGTELKKSRVPSNGQGDELILGALAAVALDMVVAMPDGPGMGGASPMDYHPYCHAKSVYRATLDMVPAALKMIDGKKYAWDGRLFIIGYSEGGYISMSCIKAIQMDPDYRNLNLTGAAAMAGPYDLSGTMKDTMVNPTLEYPAPFFLPYFVYGYNSLSDTQGAFNPANAINSRLLESRADGNLSSWMQGNLQGSEVNAKIKTRMGVASGHETNLRSLLNESWVQAQLTNPAFPNTDVGRTLVANDLWRGNWGPSKPLYMSHSPGDNYVPYANSMRALKAFQDAGYASKVHFEPIGGSASTLDHPTAGVVGIPLGFIWLKEGMPMAVSAAPSELVPASAH